MSGMNHDVIVIGASAGGLAPLLELAEHLPAELPASLFVVLHSAPDSPSRLPELLNARGSLPARHPMHDERMELGKIYVAPPDNHLLLRPGGLMEVVRGPRENGHRPAADALFRSASASYGSRVVGVVLSGYQTCGTAGMLSVRARGGLCVVQSPDNADVPEMPRSVLENVSVDHVVAASELPALLVRLVGEPASPSTQLDDSVAGQLAGITPGLRAPIVCPDCHGVLDEVRVGEFEYFRCHVGHTYTIDSLLRAQNEDVERALWSAVRALEEGAAMARRLSGSGTRELRERFAEKAQTHTHQAELIRQILLGGTSTTLAGNSLS